MKGRAQRRAWLAVISVWCGLLLAIPPTAHAQSACPLLAPAYAGGSTSVLGIFVEIGMRCISSTPIQFVAGLRYTERATRAQPFAVASYSLRRSAGWDVLLVASYRERLGDYEGHRLPELVLRKAWDGPSWVPSLELSSGIISIIQRDVLTVRVGGIAGVRTPTVRLGPTADLSGSFRAGFYAYGSGESHAFWIASAKVTQQLPRGMHIGLAYTRHQGTGASPLLYDFTGFDQYVTAHVSAPINSTMRGTLSATVGFHTPVMTMREYVLSINHARGWSAGVSFTLAESKVQFSVTLP